jgi:hypothetical protein
MKTLLPFAAVAHRVLFCRERGGPGARSTPSRPSLAPRGQLGSQDKLTAAVKDVSSNGRQASQPVASPNGAEMRDRIETASFASPAAGPHGHLCLAGGRLVVPQPRFSGSTSQP